MVYVIEDGEILQRFERDFFCSPEERKHIRKVTFYRGYAHTDGELSSDGFRSLGRIQEKEAVYRSLGGEELRVSCPGGNSRINHFKAVIHRVSEAMNQPITVEVREATTDYLDQARSWVERIGEIPSRLVVGSARGISTLLFGFSLQELGALGEEFQEYYQKRVREYTSKKYLSWMSSKNLPHLDERVLRSLESDELFNRDSQLLWGIKKFGTAFSRGLGVGTEYHVDDFLDYALFSKGGNRVLNIHYPYGDQVSYVLKALSERSQFEELWYIGSCGLLNPALGINDIIIPNSVSNGSEKIDFDNQFSKNLDAVSRNIHEAGVPLDVFRGSARIVDTPLDETVEQLQGFAHEGHICVDTEAFHLIRASEGIPKRGIIYYASDSPLANLTLPKMPASFIGWRPAVRTLVELLGR